MIDKVLASLRATIELSRHDFMRNCGTAALATLFGLASLGFGAFAAFLSERLVWRRHGSHHSLLGMRGDCCRACGHPGVAAQKSPFAPRGHGGSVVCSTAKPGFSV